METIVISHLNKETSEKFLIKIKKSFTIIYGKNGSGKTTISRNEIFDKKYVFNTDYIHKNIYIESATGSKDDSSTKESFTSLWIGEEIVAIKSKLDESKKILKMINDKYTILKNKINESFNKYKLSPDYSRIDGMCKKNTIVINLEDNVETLIESFVSKIILHQNITNNEEFNEKYNILQNNNILKMFINNIKKDELLSEMYLSEEDSYQNEFQNYIIKYNENLNELNELDKVFQSNDIELENKWICEAIRLHNDIDFCLFCGNKNIKEAKEKWKKVLNSKVKEQKNKFLKEIDEHLSNIGIIEANYLMYQDVCPKVINSIIQFKNKLNLLKKYIINGTYIDFSMEFIKEDKSSLVFEENKILEECHDYLFKNYLSQYEILFHLNNKYLENINMLEKNLIEKMNENADTISKTINKSLIKLGLEKELEVKLEYRGNSRKYNFAFKNKKTSIGTLSDGQKHKLALAIFFASIKTNGIRDKIIVLDDPVVTLDQRTYYAIREEIIELNSLKPRAIILMTHNISYLQIQLSNLFNKDLLSENVTFYHLLGSTIKEIDPNILNYDDLILYKKALSELSSYEEFSILATINIRMYRYFLDFYMRILGIPSVKNPADEIDDINVDITNKKELKNINAFIEKNCKNLKASNNDLYLSFEKLNNLISILGYPKLINDNELEKLKRFNTSDVRKLEYSGDNIVFQILFWVHCAMLHNDKSDKSYTSMKNYISHPRHQMTSSIVGIDFNNSELDDFIKND